MFNVPNPPLHFRLLRSYLMAIDAEALCDVGTWEGFLYILHAVSKTRAFVGGERNDGLALQVALMLLEEGKHHLWISTPPYWTTDEYRIVL